MLDQEVKQEITNNISNIKFGNIRIILNKNSIDIITNRRKRFKKQQKEDILNYLDSIKFGNIEVVLNETANHIDIITEHEKSFVKKNKTKKIVHIKNKYHED